MQHRRKGFQLHSISSVIDLCHGEYRLWYVTDEKNTAPIKCVEKIGFVFRCFGVRKKYGPLGLFSKYLPDKDTN